MLVASKLDGVANLMVMGSQSDLEKAIIDLAIKNVVDSHELKNARVVIKGCGELPNRDYAYFSLAKALVPQVLSLMYGEPCSTVPVFKKRNK